MLNVYHQVAKNRAHEIITQGLLQGSGGERRNKDIEKTDALLNELRPQTCLQASLDRDRNAYCYLADNDGVVDIVTGQRKKPADIVEPGQTLLTVQVDPQRCYVSDLDLYDKLVEYVKQADREKARITAQAYWAAVQRLDSYDHSFRRPEVMVTYDVPPISITDCV
jgi:hypothetical protein